MAFLAIFDMLTIFFRSFLPVAPFTTNLFLENELSNSHL